MPRHRIRAHYEQLSEFERGHIILLKETRFSDKSCFQLYPDNQRRHVWRHPRQSADPAFPIARHTGLNQELWSGVPFHLTAGPFWSSLVAHLQHNEDKARPLVVCVAMKCLTACQSLPWTSTLPNVSPIEYVWDMMGRRLHLLGNVVTCQDNWSKFCKKYRRRPSECFITLWHVWQLASSSLNDLGGGFKAGRRIRDILKDSLSFQIRRWPFQSLIISPGLSLQSKRSRALQTALLSFRSGPLCVAAVAEWYRYRIMACFVTGSSPVPLKTRRVGQRCTLNLSRAETSSLGVVW
ncbi:transposable element Tc1 transposase [Trichonephila clavipes]|nr:transposable element Tc1 transposase [Trichonephila clavipes]